MINTNNYYWSCAYNILLSAGSEVQESSEGNSYKVDAMMIWT
jgi:hypothetical protein